MKRLALVILWELMISAGTVGAAGSISYIDKLGRTIDISVPVNRAVFFQTYELIPVLDIWDKVVGIGRYAYDNDLMQALNPNIRSIISAGSGGDVNIEVLLKLKPDVVITWAWKPDAIRFMEEKGLRVIAIYPDTLAELYDVMRLHGALFDREVQIERTISAMENLISLIRERAARIPMEKRKTVLYLGGKMNSVSCGIGITHELFDMIGTIQPSGSIPQRNAIVSTEQLIMWNPDVLFIWGNAGYGVRDVLNQTQMRQIRAVKDGKVFKCPSWSTWSPRLAPIALWMAASIYPEYYQDIALEEVFDTFFREVFHVPYAKVTHLAR